MTIKNLKKGKKNTYEITFQDGLKYLFYDDIIVKYSLIPKKELTDKELKEIINENEKLESYYLAIQLLNSKQRTKKEITIYLKRKNFSQESIDLTIARLEKEGYLKESTYIRSFLNDGFRFTNDGPLKLKRKLLENDLSEALIDEVFNEIEKDLWLEKLAKIYQKKADSHHTDGLEKWKYKCLQYLKQLGYPIEWINEITSKITWKEDASLIQKEKEKLNRKLSRKYQGNELEFQINHRLYLKGFSKEEIAALKKER
ncbi:MAG: hypothetical protein HFI09_02200 [Bacilli bacterium]|nr:hypothetical protein [Bacilli bacterium]